MKRSFLVAWHGYWGWVLGAIALILRQVLAAFPHWTETWYSRGFFAVVRRVLDLFTGLLPFPAVYLLLAALAGYLVWSVRRLGKSPYSRMRKSWLALRGLVNFSGWVLFAFFALWGYNYYRIPAEAQLGLELEPLSEAALWADLERETALLLELRQQLPDGPITAEDLPAHMENELRQSLAAVLQEQGFSVAGHVRGRLIRPAGIFLRFSTAGLYLPFTGEGHVDPGLAPVQWPYVMAHELSHGYGFGDEGTCNFWAYLTCMQSADPLIRYAGAMGYWRSLAAACRRYDRERFAAFREKLPPIVLRDLEDINAAMLRYPDLVPRLQYRIYDAYLKSQGIAEGMLNYDRVLLMLHAWKNRADAD